MPGARRAIRRERLTQLVDDPSVPPVATTIVIARGRHGGSVCLVVHRTEAAPASLSEAIVRSLALENPVRAGKRMPSNAGGSEGKPVD